MKHNLKIKFSGTNIEVNNQEHNINAIKNILILGYVIFKPLPTITNNIIVSITPLNTQANAAPSIPYFVI